MLLILKIFDLYDPDNKPLLIAGGVVLLLLIPVLATWNVKVNFRRLCIIIVIFLAGYIAFLTADRPKKEKNNISINQDSLLKARKDSLRKIKSLSPQLHRTYSQKTEIFVKPVLIIQKRKMSPLLLINPDSVTCVYEQGNNTLKLSLKLSNRSDVDAYFLHLTWEVIGDLNGEYFTIVKPKILETDRTYIASNEAWLGIWSYPNPKKPSQLDQVYFHFNGSYSDSLNGFQKKIDEFFRWDGQTNRSKVVSMRSFKNAKALIK